MTENEDLKQPVTFTVAPVIRKILERLAAPEAVNVVEELARKSCNNNNNNNNNKRTPLETRLLERVQALPNERLAEILQAESS